MSKKRVVVGENDISGSLKFSFSSKTIRNLKPPLGFRRLVVEDDQGRRF